MTHIMPCFCNSANVNVHQALCLSSYDWSLSETQITVKPNPEDKFYTLKDGRLAECRQNEILQRHRVVFGCSGVDSFHSMHLPLLCEKSLLVSASSWTVEFPKDEWIAASRSSNPRNLNVRFQNPRPMKRSIHQTLSFAIGNHIVLLANSGYPINFLGSVNSAPPELMQPTVSLMLAGAVQAVTEEMAAGEHQLDSSKESWIVETYRDIMSKGEQVVYLT